MCAVISTSFQWQLECLLMAVSELPGKEVLAEEQGFTIERRYNMAFWNSMCCGHPTSSTVVTHHPAL
jgi:hypothetical protein